MFAHLILVGRSFFRLQRHWFLGFFALEGLFLALTLLGLQIVSRQWFTEFQQVDLVWLCVVPSFVFQLLLALHLGLSFNLKAPEAWVMRLPLSKTAISLFSCLLIWINA